MKIEKNQKVRTGATRPLVTAQSALHPDTRDSLFFFFGSASNLPRIIYHKQLVRPFNEANEVFGFLGFFWRAATEQRLHD